MIEDWQGDYSPETGYSAICPECGSDDTDLTGEYPYRHICNECGHEEAKFQ